MCRTLPSPLRRSPFLSAALVALFAISGATGCGVVEDATDEVDRRLGEAAEAAGAHNLQGTMPLRWRSKDGTSGPVRFVLAQDGLAIDGVAVFEGHPCLTELAVNGKVETSGLYGDMRMDDVRFPFELSWFDQHGPKPSLSGALRSVDNVSCLAEDGALQLESL